MILVLSASAVQYSTVDLRLPVANGFEHCLYAQAPISTCQALSRYIRCAPALADRIAYQLYGLTDEGIAIVEGE